MLDPKLEEMRQIKRILVGILVCLMLIVVVVAVAPEWIGVALIAVGLYAVFMLVLAISHSARRAVTSGGRNNQTLQWSGPRLKRSGKLKSVGAGPAIQRWSVIWRDVFAWAQRSGSSWACSFHCCSSSTGVASSDSRSPVIVIPTRPAGFRLLRHLLAVLLAALVALSVPSRVFGGLRGSR